MASQAKLEKMEMRQRYQNFWHTDLLSATTDDPFFCCFALWCGPCASYVLRKRALYNDMSRYTCCGGYMPCSGHCGESKCPEFCLCTEVFLFFANSVASTRFMIQDEFNIRTTKCDNCIIGCMFCLQQLACIFSLIACIVGSDEIEEASQLLNCLADMVYCSVCPCMQTQHKIELDKRDGKFGGAPAMAVPTVQQMSRLDQHLPPPVGFLPPAAYSYPPPPQAQGSFPPPQCNGYPPLPQSYGHPPQTQGYYLPPQAYGFHPPPQGHGPPLEFPPSQAQGFSPASHFHGYPTPPPQSQGSPPWPPLQSSPPQAQGFPPPLQSHEHPPPPPVQGYTPPSAAPPTGHPG